MAIYEETTTIAFLPLILHIHEKIQLMRFDQRKYNIFLNSVSVILLDFISVSFIHFYYGDHNNNHIPSFSIMSVARNKL